MSACAAACPPNTPAIALVIDSSLSLEPTAPSTAIPYLDKALVDEPNVFDTKSAAATKSIPLAAAKSNVAFVAAATASSSFINEAIIACASNIASSPYLLTCCNDFACCCKAKLLLPKAAVNFLSANSCLPANSIKVFMLLRTILAPCIAAATAIAPLAIPARLLETPFTLPFALLKPLVLASIIWVFLVVM